MRISDLSRASGVSIPTIKFYLRESILAAGRRTAANQATYDESHLRRLRLVGVLTDVGGLSLAAVRRVLEAVDDEHLPLPEILGVAHRALDDPWTITDSAVPAALIEVDLWLRARQWDVTPDAPARSTLATTLVALRRLGWEIGPSVFDRYADHMDAIARDELAYVAGTGSREAAVEATVIGTVVFERAMAALRRLSQERHSRELIGS